LRTASLAPLLRSASESLGVGTKESPAARARLSGDSAPAGIERRQVERRSGARGSGEAESLTHPLALAGKPALFLLDLRPLTLPLALTHLCLVRALLSLLRALQRFSQSLVDHFDPGQDAIGIVGNEREPDLIEFRFNLLRNSFSVTVRDIPRPLFINDRIELALFLVWVAGALATHRR
jgi:hypothetical protein